jgi:hypothetical protein
MPKDTSVSASFRRAAGANTRAFDIALDKMGRVPFGEQKVDPRTLAARSALLQGVIPTLPFNSNYIQQKNTFPKDIGNHPQLKPTSQNARTAAGGKVVDPTAIESAQSADWVTVDTAGSGGMNTEGTEES